VRGRIDTEVDAAFDPGNGGGVDDAHSISQGSLWPIDAARGKKLFPGTPSAA
jgi:hypothetical protein